MKNLFFSVAILSLATNLNAQCTINPIESSGLVTSGVFNAEYGPYGNLLEGKNDIAIFKNSTQSGIVNLDVLNSCNGFETVWTGPLDLNKMKGRILNLDIDGDGLQSDIVAIYDNGNSTITLKVWTFNFVNSSWSFTNAWTSSIGYDGTKIIDRVVAGDFDRDGVFDDIAAFYDYGNSNTKIHVFKFNSILTLAYSWYYETSGYDANKITGRVVSGDFDRDGFVDDIAALYDYGTGGAKMHVFNSNGTTITQNNPFWETTGYNANMTTGTLVSGNFDKSGTINHYNDDIIAFYDYGSGNVKAHVWSNTGNNNFGYSWKWQRSGFNVSEIRGRVFQFQNKNDNGLKNYHVAALYNYGTSTDKYYKWTNNFSNPWDFGSNTVNFCCIKEVSIENDNSENPQNIDLELFPIPASDILNIKNNQQPIISINVYNLTGDKINITTFNEDNTMIDVSNLSKGI